MGAGGGRGGDVCAVSEQARGGSYSGVISLCPTSFRAMLKGGVNNVFKLRGGGGILLHRKCSWMEGG